MLKNLPTLCLSWKIKILTLELVGYFQSLLSGRSHLLVVVEGKDTHTHIQYGGVPWIYPEELQIL